MILPLVLLGGRAMDLKERIECQSLLQKVMEPGEAARVVESGMRVGTSGSTSLGYPKAFFSALAERAKAEGPLKVELWTAAPLGDEVDGALAEAGVMTKRLCMQSNPKMAKRINEGSILYQDLGPSTFAQKVRYGQFGEVDLAVIEAIGVTKEGYIIPSMSVADGPTMVVKAKRVIVEINDTVPMSLFGMHDIYVPEDPPNRRPIPITAPEDRIGAPYIVVDPEKIVAIVGCSVKSKAPGRPKIDPISEKIAENVIQFLRDEVSSKRLPQNLLPFQSGLGSLGGAILIGLSKSEFENLKVHSALLDDGILDLIDQGKLTVASGAGLFLSEEGQERFFASIDSYRDRMILRPVDVTNSPEVIQRLGVIALNSAIEIDIYGHVNSSHIQARNILSGVGGSVEFSRNGFISIFMTPSTAKGGDISAIVPMVSHVDHTEHEVDVIVTEYGAADIRGLDPRDRARTIIRNCAHPDYRPVLEEYLETASRAGGHEPHILAEAFSFHERLARAGSMKKS